MKNAIDDKLEKTTLINGLLAKGEKKWLQFEYLESLKYTISLRVLPHG